MEEIDWLPEPDEPAVRVIPAATDLVVPRKKSNMVDKKCADVEWYTPPEIVARVKAFFLDFARDFRLWREPKILDPFTAKHNPFGADVFFTKEDDGLTKDWITYAPFAFVNPPYGKDIWPSIAKIREQAEKGLVTVAILPGQRFEADRWQRNLFNDALSGMCFVLKRVKFIRPDGTRADQNPYGSMLYFYNTGWMGGWDRIVRHFGDLGMLVEFAKVRQAPAEVAD